MRSPVAFVSLAIAALLCGSMAVLAQDAGDPIAPSDPDSVLAQVQEQIDTQTPSDEILVRPLRPTGGILTLNQERFIASSLYGQRIQREVDAARIALSTENREIEAELTEEELRLTELRATTEPDEFRQLAEDFDTRVEAIRQAQEDKSRTLQLQAEAAQARFFELAFPILLDIVQSRGADVLMDRRAVLLSADGVDITDVALERVDAEIGEGGPEALIDLDAGDPRPLPRP